MPIAYRLLTALLGLTGSLGLVITGEINPVMALGGLAIVPGYYRLLKGKDAAPARLVGMLSLCALVVFFFDSAVSGDFFLAVAHLTIIIQAIKSYDLKEPWDHLQVYFVSLLQMVIASELSQSLLFGGVFIVFLAALVAAMVFSHFIKEGRVGETHLAKSVVLISMLSLVVTTVFFIALPRTGHRFFGKSHAKGIKTSGFSDRVDFGSFGDVKLDPTVIMRVETDRDPPLPYYWRGLSLDYFSGISWRNSGRARNRAVKTGDIYIFSPYNRLRMVEQRIYLEPMESDVIFGLAEIKGIIVDSFSVQTDKAGDIFLARKSSRRVSYTVYSEVGNSFGGKPDPIYLQSPPELKKAGDLARAVTLRAKTPGEKALLLERYLKTNYTYSLSSEAPGTGISPVEDFLFRSKKGYCEHFATAMVIMLRQMGIPSRIVNGFYGGERNTYGGYIIVRQRDAHSWVEAMIDDTWTRFDPTPEVPPQHLPAFTLLLDSITMKWTRYVVGFRTDDQKAILRSLSAPLALSTTYFAKSVKTKVLLYLIPLLVLCIAFIAVIRSGMRIRKYGFVSGKYLALRRVMARGHHGMLSYITPREIVKMAGGSGVEDEIELFITLYEEHRFGRRPMSDTDRRKYALLLRQIKKGLARRTF